jgi:hypothetical protein
MAGAAFAIPNFLGGEISQFAQGRFDKPDYRVSMRVCLNSFPVEIGAWTRRPGTRHAGHTRKGLAARAIKFDFQEANSITTEFTDGVIRFRSGTFIVWTNDGNLVAAISATNPAVLTTLSPHGWSTGNTVTPLHFSGPMLIPSILQNRQFVITVTGASTFSISDPITGAGIDGSTFSGTGWLIVRIQELTTPYIGGSWSSIRAVQAETTQILLNASVASQALKVTTLPAANVNPVLALNPVVFNDGPYLDPFTNGVLATPSAKSGIIDITLSFSAFDTNKAYAAGAFVTSGGVNYVSLLDQNAGNAPAGLAPWWATTSASAAINGGKGFVGTDTGRLVRLFSEPPAWVAGTTYSASTAAAPVIVSYNPSGSPGATTYWSAAAGSTGKAPGTDITNWTLVSQAAIWSWGKITGLSNIIDRSLAGSVAFGDMTSGLGGGVAAAFNGAFSQNVSASALAQDAGGITSSNTPIAFVHYVGKNYSGASDQKIQQAVVYPSFDEGLGQGTAVKGGITYPMEKIALTLNLRAKSSAPASSSDGTLLAAFGTTNFSNAITLISSDQVTAWKYVWVEIVIVAQVPGDGPLSFATSYSFNSIIAQISFFSPTGTGTSAGARMEVLGPALLYTSPISIWRLGVYSDTTGWPTCGLYNDGRLYLGGAVGNRFDACVSNGIVGGTVNFAPTDQYGAVAPSSAISYTFNSDGVNKILWMDGDLQGIKMGTQAGEWLVVAPTAGSIAPNNISARNVTKHGSANIQPCRTEHTTVFAQRFAQKLLEFFPDVMSGKFSAPNLADKAQHLTRAGVAELAYTSAVTPIIWGRDTSDALFGITYKRDSLASAQPPTFYAWHHHALGSGRVVESMCAGLSVGGNLDSLTMVTNDPVTGLRHVEVLTDVPDETAPLASAWFLDNAVVPSSNVVTVAGVTLNGLWHLNGKTVQVFAGGLDCGDPGEGNPPVDFLVTNGSVFVPFGDSISVGPGRGLFTADFIATNPPIVVGFTYNSDGQGVRMIAQADTGARIGPAFGNLLQMHRYKVKLVNTLGLSVGADFDKLIACDFMQKDESTPIPALTTFSGIHQDTLNSDPSYDDALAWRASRPFPATIVAIGADDGEQDQ